MYLFVYFFDYIECLFIFFFQVVRDLFFEGNFIYSVELVLSYVEDCFLQGLSCWLVVVVNDYFGLDQVDVLGFCVVCFFYKVSFLWLRNQVMFIVDVGLFFYFSFG